MSVLLRTPILTVVLVLGLGLWGCSDNPVMGPSGQDSGDLFWSLAPPAGYYDTVDPSTAAALRTTLHDVVDDHTRFPYTSSGTDTWDILEAADEDPNDPSSILDVYANESYAKEGGGNSFYNREHTWPKSFGFPNDNSSNYPYTDCHALFLCDDGYNSSRSNKPYRYCSAACTEKVTAVNDGQGGGSGVYPGNSSWTSGSLVTGTWETWIGRRGDVARGLLYLDVRYEGGTHGVTSVSEPDLILTDNESLIDASNTGNNESVAYMGMLSVLLLWHIEDPVDDRERARNDEVFANQGNRNPFVDHPEWVDCLFNGNCGSTAPAAPANLAAAPGDGIVDLDWDDNSEPNLTGYNVYRATTSGGPYTQLNGSLLATSLYSDASVSNGTTYYYVVTAENDVPLESDDSNEASATPTGGGSGGAVVWINEFHYDDKGGDANEAVEVAGIAGTSLAGWSVIGYNGSGGGEYKTVNLSGTLPDQQGGFGTLDFAFTGMQNGSPDGLALIDDGGAVVQFLSYEGSITASDGPASGLSSTDIGVSETPSTPNGHSLQLTGNGSAYNDFTWMSPSSNTRGVSNTGQTFGGGDVTPPAAPTNLASIAGDGTVSLDWGDNGEGDLAGYRVYRSTTSGGSYSEITASLLGSSAYVDNGVTNGTTYYYVVTAEDNSGNESANSGETSATPTAAGSNPVVWINEFHYDDKGSDQGEFVEVAGTAGTDLSGWQIVGYNGSGGGTYFTLNLSGTISDQQSGFGTVDFAQSGIQNGSPDGLALVDDSGTVVEFLSYEGSFEATDGPASGQSSTDIGVSENSSTKRGHSLQKTGTGTTSADFTWQSPMNDTPGSPNTGQTFGGGSKRFVTQSAGSRPHPVS